MPLKTIDRCVECGRPKAEHHLFTPLNVSVPDGCTCDVASWSFQDVPPVCSGFEPMRGDKAICLNCEHNRKCHR